MQEAAAAAAAAAVAASQTDQVLPLEDDEQEAAELAEDVLEGLRRLDQGSGNRITWYVYSNTPGKSGSSEGYIDKLRSADQLDEDRFKRLYGPGEYRIIGRTRDGAYVKGSHRTVKISDIGVQDQQPAADVVSMLREMRAAEEDRATKRAENLKATATILATPLATVLAALIARRPSIDLAALVTALRPQQSTVAELTTALVQLRQLEQGSGGATGGVDVVLKLLERLQDLPLGGQGDGAGWLGIIRDVIRETAPAVRDVFQRQAGAAPGQLPPGATSGPPFGPGVPSLPPTPKPNGSAAAPSFHSAPSQSSPGAPPSATPTPTGSPSAEVSTTEAGEMLQLAEPWLRRRATDLQEWASNNMDVELCAEMLYASVPKGFRHLLTAELLTRPDWWQFVVGFHPPLEPYAAWIDDLRQQLVVVLEDERRRDQEAPADPEGEGKA